MPWHSTINLTPHLGSDIDARFFPHARPLARYSFPPETARPRYRRALHRFACFCAGSVLFLICLGGLVTSNEAGMSVPDWPTTYGHNMFLFPVAGLGRRHFLRAFASAGGVGVGVLDRSILAVWLCFQERIWLRWMGDRRAGLRLPRRLSSAACASS